MTEPDKKNIPERVSALEAEMREVRVLAVGADHDVSTMEVTLRAHIGTLNALRETQLEQGQGLNSLRQTQLDQGQEMQEGFQKVDAEFKNVAGEFSKIHDGIAGITALLADKPSAE